MALRNSKEITEEKLKNEILYKIIKLFESPIKEKHFVNCTERV